MSWDIYSTCSWIWKWIPKFPGLWSIFQSWMILLDCLSTKLTVWWGKFEANAWELMRLWHEATGTSQLEVLLLQEMSIRKHRTRDCEFFQFWMLSFATSLVDVSWKLVVWLVALLYLIAMDTLQCTCNVMIIVGILHTARQKDDASQQASAPSSWDFVAFADWYPLIPLRISNGARHSSSFIFILNRFHSHRSYSAKSGRCIWKNLRCLASFCPFLGHRLNNISVTKHLHWHFPLEQPSGQSMARPTLTA